MRGPARPNGDIHRGLEARCAFNRSVIMTNGRARREIDSVFPDDSIRFIARFGAPRFESRFVETDAKLLYLPRRATLASFGCGKIRELLRRGVAEGRILVLRLANRCGRMSSAMTELRRSSDLQITESRGVHDRVKSDSSRRLFRALPLNSI